jgi:hypothetical protein
LANILQVEIKNESEDPFLKASTMALKICPSLDAYITAQDQYETNLKNNINYPKINDAIVEVEDEVDEEPLEEYPVDFPAENSMPIQT